MPKYFKTPGVIHNSDFLYLSYLEKNPPSFGYKLHPTLLPRGAAEISEVAQIVIVFEEFFLIDIPV